MHRVIFYSETVMFGGHERMAVTVHQAITEHFPEIVIQWVIHARNDRLAAALATAGIPYTPLDADPTSTLLRNPVAVLKKINRVARQLRALRPDLVVVVQGTITDALDAAVAVRLTGAALCSYLPMAHRWKELGLARRGTALRSALTSLLYRLSPEYVTIDKQQAIRIHQQAPRAIVRVVENYTPGLPPLRAPKTDAQKRLDIPPGQKVIGVVGRIEFVQKGQDWLVRTLQDHEFLADKLLLFIGDGADRDRLAEMIFSSPAKDRMRLLGWRENMDDIYASLDLLLLPSRMEGVPLAMLEALARRLPVVGTDRDGMKSWLPEAWRFPFEDGQAMLLALNQALNGDYTESWREIDLHLAKITDYSRFAREFYEALKLSCR